MPSTISYPIEFKFLHEHSRVPQEGTEGSAGYDLYAVEPMTIDRGAIVTIPLGFSTDMPPEMHGRIESRSGMALKGLVVLTGVIDSDYRGEWKVILQNTSSKNQVISQGDRVAQVVFRPTIKMHPRVVSELSETSRGAGGFGSTGTNDKRSEEA